MEKIKEQDLKPWQRKMHEVIFEAETPAGKFFDIALLVLILASIIIVMLESVPEYRTKFGDVLITLEWIVTGIFTIEYFARIISLKRPISYIFSFWGLIDLLSILPSYVGIFVTAASPLKVLRSLRLLRIFRILNLPQFINDSNRLTQALKASKNKIIVFLFVVMMLVIILGTIMYIIEGGDSGFTSIPRGIYWAIVTLTTVGYGDIAPVTALGQFVASIVMILGYAIIAVPTGIVTGEMISMNKKTSARACENCSKEGHDEDAEYCKYCGDKL